MKRSGFKRPSIEEALQTLSERRVTAMARQVEKRAQTLGLSQSKVIKPKSAARIAGDQRRKENKREKEFQETQWKRQVRTRDNQTCQFPLGVVKTVKCNGVDDGSRLRSPHIDCHHIAPRSRRRDLIYVVSNGICLCRNHHDWVHDYPSISTPMGLLSDESREFANKRRTSLPLD